MHPNALLEEAATLLERVFRFDQPTDALLARHFREHRSLGPRDRATLADTVFAVLRERLRLEALARSGSGSRWRRLAILAFPGDIDFLKSALSEPEKTWLDACRATPDSAWLAPHRHNLPDWLAAALQAQIGNEFDTLAEALMRPAPLDLRVNTLKARRDAVLAELAAGGLTGEPTPWSPLGIRLAGKPTLARWQPYADGAVEVQDEGSQLLALLVGARRGEMVADFCAGAGGKTLALGAAMRNTGRLYAFDTSAHRLEGLKPRLARSGLSNVHPVAIAHERDDRIKRLAGKLDRVLVDAPCSGLGTLRRHPDLKWRQTPAAVAAFAAQQTAILASAARLLKPGGRLVYATCSLLTDENEAIAAAFDAAQSGWRPLSAATLLADAGVHDPAALASGPEGRFLRLWPHRHRTDGFFAAVWQKTP